MACPTIQSIKGKVVLVTGGYSGLGRGTLERMIREGAKGVVAFDLKFPEKINIPNVLSVTGDVTKEEDVKRALDLCEKQFGRLDAVVNCAGMTCYQCVYDFKAQAPHPLELLRKVLDVNVVGTFNV